MSQVKLLYQLDLAPASQWLTVTASKNAKSSLLYVQELGDFISHEKYYTQREGLDSYLIKFTLSGEGLLDYQGQTHTIKPGLTAKNPSITGPIPMLATGGCFGSTSPAYRQICITSYFRPRIAAVPY